MKLIYVCSPYSGDVERNVELAKKYSRYVVQAGHAPITPHLYLPSFIDEKTERNLAFQINCEILSGCDELWVFGGRITKGMRFEFNTAQELGKTIRIIEGLYEEDLDKSKD